MTGPVDGKAKDQAAARGTALDRALAASGGARPLARALGISHSAIIQWNGRVPLARVPAVEAATGVPRWELRPDHYDPPAGSVPAPGAGEAAE